MTGTTSRSRSSRGPLIAGLVVAGIMVAALVGLFVLVPGGGGGGAGNSSTSTSTSSESSTSSSTSTTSSTHSTSFSSSSSSSTNTQSSTVTGTPFVQYVFPAKFTDASCSGTSCPSGSQIEVTVGHPVGTSITLNANTTTAGTAKVEIRRDIVWSPDTVAKDFTQQVTLEQGTNVIVLPTFTASASTCGSAGCVNQYYVKVFWNGQVIYDPTDPSAREWVKTTGTSSSSTTSSSASSSSTTSTSTTSGSCSEVKQADGLYATVCGTTTYSVSTTISGQLYWVNVQASDQYGNPLFPGVSMDGGSPKKAPAAFQTTVGTHTVTCGQLDGYTTSRASFSFTQTGATTLQTCQYTKANTSTTTLTVYVQYCNAAGLCLADPDVQVTLTISTCPANTVCGATYVLSDHNGNAVFTVQTNQYYSVRITAGGTSSSTLSQSVNVGTTPARATLTYRYANNALSGLGLDTVPGGLYTLLAVIVASVVGVLLASRMKRHHGRGMTTHRR